jgi:hypothetical protein
MILHVYFVKFGLSKKGIKQAILENGKKMLLCHEPVSLLKFTFKIIYTAC